MYVRSVTTVTTSFIIVFLLFCSKRSSQITACETCVPNSSLPSPLPLSTVTGTQPYQVPSKCPTHSHLPFLSSMRSPTKFARPLAFLNHAKSQAKHKPPNSTHRQHTKLLEQKPTHCQL